MPTPAKVPSAATVVPPGPLLNWLQNLEQVVNRLGEARAYAKIVPTTGFSQQIPPATGMLLLVPAGTLASGTIVLPVSASDGFEQHILSTQSVSSLTVTASSGQNIVGTAASSLTAAVEIAYRFEAATSTWYRMR